MKPVASAAWEAAGKAVAAAARAMMERMNCMVMAGLEAGACWFGKFVEVVGSLDGELMS